MIPFLKVLHINNGDETDITKYVESCIVSTQSEAKKNSTTLTLKNPNNKLSSLNFEKDDSTIKVYIDWSPINGQNPIMISTLTTISYPVNESGFSTIKLKSLDKTGLFLSKLWSFSYAETEGLSAQEIIQNVITPITNAKPIPTGKATAIPAISIAATKSMLAKLNTIPPSKADQILELSATVKSSKNPLPSSPELPIVKAKMSVISKTPIE